jgi:hypothetical protein
MSKKGEAVTRLGGGAAKMAGEGMESELPQVSNRSERRYAELPATDSETLKIR